MSLDGTIERNGNTVIVTAENAPDSLKIEGVTCLNPDDPPEKRIYQKKFTKKKIFLPGEYDNAVKSHIEYPDRFVVSMNGYTSISEEQARRYGIVIGAYEQACKAILNHIVRHIKEKFDKTELKLIHGATYLGVDGAIQDVANEHNIIPLGFSCPRYMLYVEDDNIPVYVGADREEYSNRFIQTLDLLVATGGREQALQHDVLAACIFNKRIHFIDVLNSLSTTGGVPATVTDEEGRTRVDNAAAVMGKNLSFFSYKDTIRTGYIEGDIWDAIFSNVRGIASEVCRQKMSPQRKFQYT